METQDVLTKTLRVLAIGARKSVLDALSEDANAHHIEVEGTQNMDITPDDLGGQPFDLVFWGRAVLPQQKESQKISFSAAFPHIEFLDGFAPIPQVLTAQLLEWKSKKEGNAPFEAHFDQGNKTLSLKVIEPSFFTLQDFSLSAQWAIETREHHQGYLAAGEYQFPIAPHSTTHFLVLNTAKDDCRIWQGWASPRD